MIYIDVLIAGTEKWYEFRCNEKKTVGEVTVSVFKAVLKKENIEDKFINEKIRNQKVNLATMLWMCSIDQEKVLDASMTMEECGIANGHRLLLV